MYQAARIAKSNLAKHPEFRVGVYLETDLFPISTGNVQHRVSKLTMCAESLAVILAKSNGAKPTHLYMTSDTDKPILPCGICREYLSEFPKLKITTYNKDGSKKITKSIRQLLPSPFER